MIREKTTTEGYRMNFLIIIMNTTLHNTMGNVEHECIH